MLICNVKHVEMLVPSVDMLTRALVTLLTLGSWARGQGAGLRCHPGDITFQLLSGYVYTNTQAIISTQVRGHTVIYSTDKQTNLHMK